MATTNVPQPAFTPNGIVIPQTSAILNGVQADYDTSFGGGMNSSLSSPQGQLAMTQTAIIDYTNSLFLQLVNGIDPAYSSGRMQDAIGRIYFLSRNPAVATSVICTCIGAQSTIIPVDALATDGTNLWQCVDGGTIPGSGTIDLEFQCIVTGPIPCPANTVNQIFTVIPGWDTVNNSNAGAIGSNVEGRAAFELRRQETIQGNSVASNNAIRGNVLKVPGVTDAYVIDNPTNGSVTKGGVSLPANTLYVAVAGTYDNNAVAQALWEKKIPGTPWYAGNTSVTLTDESYPPPQPTYDISWQNPDTTAIYFDVSITNNVNVPSNALDQVTDAITLAFTGGDGGQKASIGATVYASRFYAGIANLGSWAQLISVKIGTSSPGASDNVTIDIDHQPTVGTVTLTLV